uniref:Activator of Hsp90 ATPase homologue 1-like C-terminal domain-containing protein n=1 Tax=Acrobeloides nanus TaxID=290746 RepID=A0A914CUE4_9BILA
MIKIANKELRMKWRLKKYPEGHFANVNLTLKDQNDSTDLVLKATDVPESNYEETETGFSRYYLQAIGRAFGCGMKIW